ncbi:hypothetical protein SNE40_005283 [Patella caerulea]|uniref:Fibrinogen C-terminal domain-containing protein n=1 Tax=Patella caerulea TaxID=87958 RepID=A0AAN8K3B2_PATCE
MFIYIVLFSDCHDGAVRQNIIFPPYRVLVNIKPTTASKPFEVRCFIRQFGWTDVMERNRDCLFENFNRSFVEYEEGFGSVPANRFIGLKNVRHLLNNSGTKTTLDIHLVQNNITECNLYYDKFQLLGPSYAMYLDGFISGTSLNCYNSLLGNADLNGTNFSTYDFDFTGSNQCATRMGGGWWFANNVECTRGFLTGTMDGSGTDNFWKDNFGEATLKLIAVDLRRVV